MKAVGQRLSGQSAISTQPDAVKQQLEETSEIRSDLGQLDDEMKEAQTLCQELSLLIGEQYLKDELKKRLETVALPLQGLEDLAGENNKRKEWRGRPESRMTLPSVLGASMRFTYPSF